jgi:predicted nucleic acid-binding protein
MTAADRVFVDTNAFLIARLLSLLGEVATAGKQVHDANIIATMQVHGIRRLLTNNEAHFTRFSHLIAVVPLRSFV